MSKTDREHLVERMLLMGQRSSTATVHFHEAAAEQFGLSATDVKTASLLIERGPLTAGELALHLGLTTGAITNVIDRLEEALVVRRSHDPLDRRKVIVELDPRHLAQAQSVYVPLADATAAWCRSHSDREIKLVLDFLEHMVKTLDENTRKLRYRER